MAVSLHQRASARHLRDYASSPSFAVPRPGGVAPVWPAAISTRICVRTPRHPPHVARVRVFVASSGPHADS
eukprot:12611054-Alexandrium_andersonii.AAC.1